MSKGTQFSSMKPTFSHSSCGIVVDLGEEDGDGKLANEDEETFLGENPGNCDGCQSRPLGEWKRGGRSRK